MEEENYRELSASLAKNTAMTEQVHRILVGEPEFKRPGIVERVDYHDRLILMWGGGFGVVYVAWEVIKYFHLV